MSNEYPDGELPYVTLNVARRSIHIPSNVMDTFIRQLAEPARLADTPGCSCCGAPAAIRTGLHVQRDLEGVLDMNDKQYEHGKQSLVNPKGLLWAVVLTVSVGFAGLRPAAAQTEPGSAAPTDKGTLEEIVVTAEKRESTVQKTPISMTAISGEALEAQGTTGMLEVAQETPGMSLRTLGPGQTEFEVRGLASSGGATATVGYYLDDVPISPPAFGDIGKVVIDPTLFDLNHVEILRGPQGTLYGSGSMGGTIKIVTNPAKLNTFESAVDSSVSWTDRNGGTNWATNAFINFPLLTDKAALRVVVSSVSNSGWIDRIVESPFPFPSNSGCAPTSFYGCARGNVAAAPNQRVFPDSNWSQLDTVRANLLVQATDALKITGTALYQRTLSGGYSFFDAPPGPGGVLAHYQPLNNPEPMSDYVRLSGLTIAYDFAAFQLVSTTSDWDRSIVQTQDSTEGFQNIYFLPTYYLNSTTETDAIQQFSEELRLASTGSAAFQWLVGAFYSNFRSEWDQNAISPAMTNYVYGTGAYLPVTAADNPQGLVYVAHIPYDMKQYAGFADLSYQFQPSLKLEVGGRYYKYDSTVNASQAGIFTQSVSAVPTIVNSNTSADGFNPKVNLSYIPNDDLTVYGTVSKGFRPGGINLPLPAAGPNSCTAALAAIGATSGTNNYNPDSVWSYEVGEKAKLDEGRITINTAIYYIRWDDVQQLLPLACGYFFTVNAGRARSYGSEVELHAALTSEWSANLTGGYTNATINDPDPQLGIAPGTPILNIPKYTASARLIYSRPLNANLALTAQAGATYTGSLEDEGYTYVRLPAYTLVDARFGVLTDRWKAYVSGTNLTNKVAELTANTQQLTFNIPDLTRIATNQPRTIGINASMKF